MDKTPKEVHQEIASKREKIFWPKEGYTKGDLLDYYENISKYILPHLKDRPLMLKRYPNGVEDKFFFQKRIPEFAPKWVPTIKRKDIDYMCANDLKSLLYIVNLGTIELHAFLSRGKKLSHPDYMVLDLDPENISFDHVIETAQAAHELLERINVAHFCKTSGKRGLHLYIPLGAKYPYAIADQFGRLLAQHIHEEVKSFTSLVRIPKKRQKKVYIDFLQNGEGKTMIAPYAVRALEGAPVSCPLDWKEVRRGLDPLDYTLKTMPKRLEKKGDIFMVLAKSVSLEKALKTLETH